MNIVKNLVVPAIGFSFLLGGAAFAGNHDADQNGPKSSENTYLVSDNSDHGSWGSDVNSWGSDDQGAMLQLTGDHEKEANAQLVAHHDKKDEDGNMLV